MKNVAEPPEFRRPSAGERFFNRVFGLLVGLGFGLRHNYLVQVRGRKSGKLHSTPIDLLELAGRRYLVAPRGRTQWVRNAEASGTIALKKGSYQQEFRIQPVTGAAKNELLKEYLDRFAATVSRYFPLPPGAPTAKFAPIADAYPVFELHPVEDRR